MPLFKKRSASNASKNNDAPANNAPSIKRMPSDEDSEFDLRLDPGVTPKLRKGRNGYWYDKHGQVTTYGCYDSDFKGWRGAMDPATGELDPDEAKGDWFWAENKVPEELPESYRISKYDQILLESIVSKYGKSDVSNYIRNAAINENLNGYKDVNWELYDRIQDTIDVTPKPKLSLDKIRTEEEQDDAIEAIKEYYMLQIAKKLGFTDADAMFSAVCAEDPEEVCWMLFQSFTDNLII